MKNLHQQLIQVMKGSGKQIKYPLGNYPVNADTIYIACAKLAEAVYVDNKELEKDRFFKVAANLLQFTSTTIAYIVTTPKKMVELRP